MAEIVYKDIPDLTSGTLPLAGTEYIEISQTGATRKALWSGIFGAGWWAKLAAVFTAFKAPDADHADDADTLVGEDPSDFHDAAQLTGAIHLDRIPAELTGKNSATATLATNATNAVNADTVDSVHVGVGTGKISAFNGYLHGTYTVAQIYAALSSVLATIGDRIRVTGIAITSTGTNLGFVFSYAERMSSTSIRIFGVQPVDYYHGTVTPDFGTMSLYTASSDSTSYKISITY